MSGNVNDDAIEAEVISVGPGSKPDELALLDSRLKRLESILMNFLKGKSNKDLSKIFDISEKEVREIKAISSDL